jgi:hypothetical protein
LALTDATDVPLIYEYGGIAAEGSDSSTSMLWIANELCLAEVVGHNKSRLERRLQPELAALPEPRYGHSSPGLISVEQELDEGDAIEDLLLICVATSAEELRDQIMWVPI